MKAFSKSFKCHLNTFRRRERLVGSGKPHKLFFVLLLLFGNKRDKYLFCTRSYFCK